MRGNDVIIYLNILEEMAGNTEKAAYYEQKIDYFFDKVPEDKVYFASIGLTYEPCGVIIHADGSVTYICGGKDSPEHRVKIEAINKAKREKEAARQKENQIQIIQAAMKRKQKYMRKKDLIDYSSTKGVIATLISYLSLPLVDKEMRVNAIALEPIRTPLIPASCSAEKVKTFGTKTSEVPMMRAGQLYEVSPCFIFLSSEDTSYMTGQVLHPNDETIVNS